MKLIRHYTLPLLLLLAVGCATAPERAGAPAEDRPAALSESILLAEMARSRGLVIEASRHYARAVEHSLSADLARRATQYAETAGAHADTLTAARAWAALDPDDKEALWFLALAELRAGGRDASIKAFGRWLEEADERDWQVLSGSLSREGRIWRAWQVMEGLATDDGGPGAALAAARVAMRADRLDDALDWTQRAAEAGSEDPSLFWLRLRIRHAQGHPDVLEQGRLLHDSRPGPESALELANLYWDASRLEEAREVLVSAAPAAGRMRRPMEFAIALVEIELDEPDSAADRLQRLAGDGFRVRETWFQLGRALERAGEPVQAADWYARVRAGDEAIPAQVAAARLLHEAGRTDQAEDRLEQLRWHFAAAARDLGRQLAAMYLTLDRPGEAMAEYVRLLDAWPGDPELLYDLALARIEAGDIDGGIGDLEKALATWPDEPMLLNALGYTLVDRTNRQRQGRRLVRAAIEKMPDNGAILDSMGWAEYRAGHPRRARPLLERAWTRYPHPEVAAHLGAVLWALGERDEARRIWEEGRSRWPEDDTLKRKMSRRMP
jgi:tetratricopeptide (TPR) repeat protein